LAVALSPKACAEITFTAQLGVMVPEMLPAVNVLDVVEKLLPASV
jgi:hypothetical protein